ncbi:MAG: hypothetical protein M1822_003793 [Bathelium mastoideum]|nr:MAG: hypothetical protein M1822_003793 [Bathelium mastoideum]
MFPTHDDEKWIFLNGVAVGSHWLQNNIDRISLTFGRPVSGIHNPTSGIIFDVIQCLIQRDFSYATEDVRACYDLVKKSLVDPKFKKVIFMMHSQGAIEGGMILDWLFDDMPQDLVSKLEVYTFGNAASHFNNPHRYSIEKADGHVNGDTEASFMSSSTASMNTRQRTSWKAIRHIEHYANTEDFVARWGVLHFTGLQAPKAQMAGGVPTNRFMGRVFQRAGRGHQLNLHYLDTMFPLDWERGWGVLESNEFMESAAKVSEVETGSELGNEKKKKMKRGERESLDHWVLDMLDHRIVDGEPTEAVVVQDSSPISTRQATMASQASFTSQKGLATKVKDVSRLWAYRNGLVPRDSR